jgi:hypothetical protein
MKTTNYTKNPLKALFSATLIMLLLIPSANAQKSFKLKQYIFPGSAMLLTGMLDGTIETISYHYEDGFKRVFPHANDQYWNPAISWTNKYKNGNAALGPKFPGSTNAFVGLTDAYHGLRTCKNAIYAGTLTFYIDRIRCSGEKVKLRKVLLDALVLSVIRNVGFTTTYSLLFKTAKTN